MTHTVVTNSFTYFMLLGMQYCFPVIPTSRGFKNVI